MDQDTRMYNHIVTQFYFNDVRTHARPSHQIKLSHFPSKHIRMYVREIQSYPFRQLAQYVPLSHNVFINVLGIILVCIRIHFQNIIIMLMYVDCTHKNNLIYSINS